MVNSFDLVPPHLAVKAMRDNGYKNTAYAIAEMIDNSIQAGADNVELLCVEDFVFGANTGKRQIQAIGVLDDGIGMDADVLRMALQFGNGTRLNDRSGIGRFGMGLPSASISQCLRLDVWSWQDGVDSALHTYIDLDKVMEGQQASVPEPTDSALPSEWKDRANTVAESGTLVVWTRLDRCLWKMGKTIVRNSEFLVGRMYRKFLNSSSVNIRLAVFQVGSLMPVLDEAALANDPGYLMKNTSVPAPFDGEQMFEKVGERWEIRRQIEFQGAQHEVLLRFSLAKESARRGINPGAKPHGKHAGRNVGVSLVRAGRELDLDQSLVNSYDPRERWWGVEVEFPPSLDDLFGVTNNKQSARHFSEVSERLENLKSSHGRDWIEAKNRLREEKDPSLPLIEIIETVETNISVMRKIIKVQKQSTNSGPTRHDVDGPESIATARTNKRKERGHAGASDAGESMPEDQRQEELSQGLQDVGISKKEAEEMAATTIGSGIKYTFAEADLEGKSFFSVRPVAGEILIKLNINHPAYKNLDQILVGSPNEDESADDLRDKLTRASRGLRLLLTAWARLEDEQPGDVARTEMQQIRNDWGAMAYQFLLDE